MDVEVAIEGAGYLHGAAAGDDVAGEELRHHPVGDVAQLEPVGVTDDQDQRQRDPDEHGDERLRETPAEHDQRRAAEKDQQRAPVDQRAEIAARQRSDGSFAVAGDQDEKADEQAAQQKPQQPLVHGYHLLTADPSHYRK